MRVVLNPAAVTRLIEADGVAAAELAKLASSQVADALLRKSQKKLDARIEDEVERLLARRGWQPTITDVAKKAVEEYLQSKVSEHLAALHTEIVEHQVAGALLKALQTDATKHAIDVLIRDRLSAFFGAPQGAPS